LEILYSKNLQRKKAE